MKAIESDPKIGVLEEFEAKFGNQSTIAREKMGVFC